MTLLLSTGEALVHVALCEGLVHTQLLHGGGHVLDPVTNGRCLAVNGGLCGTQEVRNRNSGYLNWVLHGQEHSRTGTLVNGHLKNVFTVEGNFTGGDVVLWVTGKGVSQGGLT